jgi:hypothetical protein
MGTARKPIWVQLFILPLLTLSLTGCWYVAVGGVGLLGGYVVSPDTVEGISQNSSEVVWDSAIEIVSIMGIIENQHDTRGEIEGKVAGAKVIITIYSVNEDTVKLTVKARKLFLPKISVAQDIFVKIMSNVNE